MEVMFHVSTLLPDDPTDEQKIEKKRHIGNDHVHIVWCEDCSGYDTSVISSQFNDAHIIIFPYPNMLYRVMAKRKNQELNFFPLPPDSIVGPKELGYLVRSTAIIADRVVRKENEMRPHEYFEKMFEVLNSDV
ncbi:Rap/ran-GAP family protein [Histomonas meleagridis]|uniref:Rap/ran-GAP family protein n=1 Tax=Histomonas meleagridis TaxID=135588 RepID=UPI0035597759|nr:Rap/ran-GAP family protein [Histomonas meleagridis]